MFQFSWFAAARLCIQQADILILIRMGCPIRIPSDQSQFAAPRGISVLTPSFIASPNLVIHYRPFVA